MRLPERQLAVLEAASATDERTIDDIAAETDLKPETVTGAAFDLRDEGLLEVTATTAEVADLTEEGRTYLRDGLPEIRLYRAAVEAGATDDPVPMGEVIDRAGLEGPEVDIALANLPRKGLGSLDSGQLRVDPSVAPSDDAEATALAALDDADGAVVGGDVPDDVLDRLASRGLVERAERTTRSVTLTDVGVTALMEGVEAAETVGQLTPELLASGEWRDVEFSEYDVTADAPAVRGGRTHVLRRTADRVKDVLVGMGFQEMEGPHAD
ncbi:MAG: phenylalanine--tRNA ligase subunit alpha, partial [Halorubrum sp.]